MKKFFVLIILILSIPLSAVADPVESVFGEGIFSTTWGMDKSEIQSIHPSSTYNEYLPLSIKNLSLSDGRKVLGVTRDKNSPIVFSLDESNSLYKIAIQFGEDDYGVLLLKLNNLLGKGSDDLNTQASSMGMVMGAKDWVGSNNTKVKLYQIKDGGVFSSYKAILTVEVVPNGKIDKGSLGLN